MSWRLPTQPEGQHGKRSTERSPGCPKDQPRTPAAPPRISPASPCSSSPPHLRGPSPARHDYPTTSTPTPSREKVVTPSDFTTRAVSRTFTLPRGIMAPEYSPSHSRPSSPTKVCHIDTCRFDTVVLRPLGSCVPVLLRVSLSGRMGGEVQGGLGGRQPPRGRTGPRQRSPLRSPTPTPQLRRRGTSHHATSPLSRARMGPGASADVAILA